MTPIYLTTTPASQDETSSTLTRRCPCSMIFSHEKRLAIPMTWYSPMFQAGASRTTLFPSSLGNTALLYPAVARTTRCPGAHRAQEASIQLTSNRSQLSAFIPRGINATLARTDELNSLMYPSVARTTCCPGAHRAQEASLLEKEGRHFGYHFESLIVPVPFLWKMV